MNRREFVTTTLGGLIGMSADASLTGQERLLLPLGLLAERNQLRCVNRTASRLSEADRDGVRLTEAGAFGVAFVPGVEFATGTIELDIRGKDVPQRSFVGVAFHGTELSACDAVFFRPFNFRASDPVARSHAVQYQSMPTYSWQRLRTERPGIYEDRVTPAPDPNDWFRARIVVAASTVTVFVADSKQPSLEINLLNDRRRGPVGLWVGNNSGGDFANLVVIPGSPR